MEAHVFVVPTLCTLWFRPCGPCGSDPVHPVVPTLWTLWFRPCGPCGSERDSIKKSNQQHSIYETSGMVTIHHYNCNASLVSGLHCSYKAHAVDICIGAINVEI